MKLKQLAMLGASFALLSGSSFGGTVYLESDAGQLYTVNAATGAFSLIGPTTVGGSTIRMFDVAFTPDGTLYGATSSGSILPSLYTINPLTGASTRIGTAPGVNSLVSDSSGTLYGAGGGTLYTIDKATGAGTVVGSGAYNSSGDLEFVGNSLYLTSVGSPNDVLYRVSPTTGAGTLLGDIGFPTVFGLAYINSTLYAFTDTGLELSLNTTTGAGTQLFSGLPNALGTTVALTGTATPEPGTLGVMVVGIAGVAVQLRRKHRIPKCNCRSRLSREGVLWEKVNV